MELRASDRKLAAGKVRLHWSEPNGTTFGCVCRVINTSSGGLCVDIERGIAIGSIVHIESSDLKVAGVAVVRHCRPKGMGFRIGLRVGGGLPKTRQRPA